MAFLTNLLGSSAALIAGFLGRVGTCWATSPGGRMNRPCC